MDGFDEPYWNVVQVAAWILFRDPKWVNEADEDTSFHPPTMMFLAAVDLETPTDEAYQYPYTDGPEKILLNALQAGEVVAHGVRNNQGNLEKISREKWTDLVLFDDLKKGPYAAPRDFSRHNATQWYHLKFERSDVLKKWPHPVITGDDQTSPVPKGVHGPSLDRLAPIWQLKALAPSEISLTLRSPEMIEVSARGKSKLVTYGVLGLVDHRTGIANAQGKVLVALANGKRDRPVDHVIKRIRDMFKKCFGINSNPFAPYPKDTLNPLFKIKDRTGAADDRAKRDASSKHDSYDESSLKHNQEERPFGDEDDEAGKFLRQHR